MTKGILGFPDRDKSFAKRRNLPPTVARYATVRPLAPHDRAAIPIERRIGQAEFEDFQIDVTIHNDVETRPGLYFQMYQGKIGDAGFYFGLQTDVYEPGVGGRGKGLIFSRWKTRD